MMSNNEPSPQKPVFTLLHGRYHGPWVWTYVQERLKRAGYDSIAPELPLNDHDATFDDHAAIVREAENAHGAKEYVNVAWSLAGDIAYRKIGMSPVSQLIFLAAPLRPVLMNKENFPEDEDKGNSTEFDEYASRSILYGVHVEAEKHGHTEFDPILIGNTFYNELDDEALKALAIGQLQPHPHSPKANDEVDEDAVLPSLDIRYLVCEKDHAVPPEWQLYVVDKLGIDHSVLKNVDHAPMLSFPNKLAKRLIKIVRDRKILAESVD